jgi:hypothetical protein
MASETDRFDAITQRIQDMLQARLATLLGEIQAVREIAGLIRDTDGDITRRELLKDHLHARLDGASAGEREDLYRRIASHDETIANLTLLRADLVGTLSAIADELRAGSGQ